MNTWLKVLAIVCISTNTLATENMTAVEIGEQKTLGIIAGDASGTYTQLAQDMSDVMRNLGEPRVMVTLGGGSVQNMVDIYKVTGIDMTIVQSDVLEAATDEATGVKNFRSYIRYVAKLHNEEFHILARPGINNLKQLQSKKVGFGTFGSGTSITASIVFNALDIEVDNKYLSNAEAVAGVRDGTLAAAVFVVGKPANYFNGISREEGLHFLPLETDKSLERAGYLSSLLTPEDYPNLKIPKEGIETIAVSAVLAVYDWDPKKSKSRYERCAIFTKNLFAKLPELQEGDTYHPKWKEINFRVEIPGWKRSKPSEEEARELQ